VWILASILLELSAASLASLAIAVGLLFGEYPPSIDDTTFTLSPREDRPGDLG
jgi:hypothetical protein